jgi:hypothetical protein
MNNFRNLELDIFYAGTNKVLNEFLIPCLGIAHSYDRLTGFFSVDSLLAIAQGIEHIWQRKGRMRLVIGIHDVPNEILEAHVKNGAGATAEIEAIEARLLGEVASLTDEMERDRIAAVAWMMKTGLLEVKVAQPNSTKPTHIFHSKSFIFRDDDNNIVTATGSPNETRPGHEGNYEDVTVHTSWETPRHVAVHIRHFDEIWANRALDLNVYDLTDEFVDLLLSAAKRSRTSPPAFLQSKSEGTLLLDAIKDAPHLGHLAYKTAILFPHQERALRDGLNRDAIRLMLADEVGLGKTLEAGALINHAVRFTGVGNVCVLAPASLLRQFQEELFSFFGLDFCIWDSASKTFVDSAGMTFGGQRFESPMSAGRPNFVIISSQLARGSKASSSIFTDAEKLPEMLVVDEAHAARVHPDQETVRPTRLWHALNEVVHNIKHVVLMTATPLQVHPLEFHGLLLLLGLPPEWGNRKSYLRSLDFLAGQIERPTLQDGTLLAKLVSEARPLAGDYESSLSVEEVDLLEKISITAGSQAAQAGIMARRNWNQAVKLLAAVHPAHGLVIRNTRRGLEKLGYKFPERLFEAPDLPLGSDLKQFFTKLEDYLDRNYGDVEEAANPNFVNSRGFAKSNYQQRLASSLFAAKESLERRILKIESFVAGNPILEVDNELLLDAEEDEVEFILNESAQAAVNPNQALAVKAAAIIEQGHIRGLLTHLNQVPSGVLCGDPKFIAAGQEISSQIVNDKILIFSRFTDTLDGFIAFMTEKYPSVLELGFALYTGGAAWIQAAGKRTASSKTDIRKSLDRGDIRLVVCSDAASEGLNLQAARVLINLDVPWNPARLEQRIGRVARLGQAADTVSITNLWYPESVEAKMYGRLLQRKDLYELAVGEFPDIFGAAIKNHARVLGAAALSDIDLQSISALEEAREQVQSKALARVWDRETQDLSTSNSVLLELRQFLDSVNSTIPDGAEATFGNIPMDQIPNPGVGDFEPGCRSVPLFKLVGESKTWGFAILDGVTWHLLSDASSTRILTSVLGYTSLNDGDCIVTAGSETSFLEKASSIVRQGFPGPVNGKITFPQDADLGAWTSRAVGELTLEKLATTKLSQ